MLEFRSLVACGILAAAPLAAIAQPPGFTPMRLPDRPPPVSPYLGLLNGNNSTAFNYYEIYRPQREFRQEFEQVNRELNQVRGNANRFGLSDAPEYEEYQLGPTGHPTMFMSTRGYFPGSR